MKQVILISFVLLSCLSLNAQEQSGIHDNKSYIIKSVFFGGGRYYIDNQQREEVGKFLEEVIIENYEIHIHSHTDNVGGVEFNQRLSRMRSEAARQMLQELGIPLDQLFIKDHGLVNPDFDNDSWKVEDKIEGLILFCGHCPLEGTISNHKVRNFLPQIDILECH